MRSVMRKIGGLRQSVEFALSSRLRRKDKISPQRVELLRGAEKELRQANGELEELRKAAREVSDRIERLSLAAARKASASLVASWKSNANETNVSQVVSKAVSETVEDWTGRLQRAIGSLAHDLHQSLESTAQVLEMKDAPSEEEFAGLLREMPAFDVGNLDLPMTRPGLLLLTGRKLPESVIAGRITKLIGPALSRSLSAYRALLGGLGGTDPDPDAAPVRCPRKQLPRAVPRGSWERSHWRRNRKGRYARTWRRLQPRRSASPWLPESDRGERVRGNSVDWERNKTTCSNT